MWTKLSDFLTLWDHYDTCYIFSHFILQIVLKMRFLHLVWKQLRDRSALPGHMDCGREEMHKPAVIASDLTFLFSKTWAFPQHCSSYETENLILADILYLPEEFFISPYLRLWPGWKCYSIHIYFSFAQWSPWIPWRQDRLVHCPWHLATLATGICWMNALVTN